MDEKSGRLAIPKRYLTTLELAGYLSKSRWWIYEMVKRREIPFIPLGRQARFDLKAIDAWMQKRAVGTI